MFLAFIIFEIISHLPIYYTGNLIIFRFKLHFEIKKLHFLLHILS